MSSLNLPQGIANGRQVLIAGMGGGYDVFGGLPIAYECASHGANIVLANFSSQTGFRSKKPQEGDDPEFALSQEVGWPVHMLPRAGVSLDPSLQLLELLVLDLPGVVQGLALLFLVMRLGFGCCQLPGQLGLLRLEALELAAQPLHGALGAGQGVLAAHGLDPEVADFPVLELQDPAFRGLAAGATPEAQATADDGLHGEQSEVVLVPSPRADTIARLPAAWTMFHAFSDPLAGT